MSRIVLKRNTSVLKRERSPGWCLWLRLKSSTLQPPALQPFYKHSCRNTNNSLHLVQLSVKVEHKASVFEETRLLILQTQKMDFYRIIPTFRCLFKPFFFRFKLLQSCWLSWVDTFQAAEVWCPRWPEDSGQQFPRDVRRLKTRPLVLLTDGEDFQLGHTTVIRPLNGWKSGLGDNEARRFETF